MMIPPRLILSESTRTSTSSSEDFYPDTATNSSIHFKKNDAIDDRKDGSFFTSITDTDHYVDTANDVVGDTKNSTKKAQVTSPSSTTNSSPSSYYLYLKRTAGNVATFVQTAAVNVVNEVITTLDALEDDEYNADSDIGSKGDDDKNKKMNNDISNETSFDSNNSNDTKKVKLLDHNTQKTHSVSPPDATKTNMTTTNSKGTCSFSRNWNFNNGNQRDVSKDTFTNKNIHNDGINNNHTKVHSRLNYFHKDDDNDNDTDVHNKSLSSSSSSSSILQQTSSNNSLVLAEDDEDVTLEEEIEDEPIEGETELSPFAEAAFTVSDNKLDTNNEHNLSSIYTAIHAGKNTNKSFNEAPSSQCLYDLSNANSDDHDDDDDDFVLLTCDVEDDDVHIDENNYINNSSMILGLEQQQQENYAHAATGRVRKSLATTMSITKTTAPSPLSGNSTGSFLILEK